MKIYKLLALAAVPVFALTACTDEVDYSPAAPVATPDTYMSYENLTKYDLNEGQDNFSFFLYRVDTKGETTANLTLTAVNTGSEETGVKNDAVDFFSVPATVTFADGEKRVPVKVTFPFEDLIPYDNYKVTVKVDGSFTTDYVLGEDTFTLFYIPWQSVEGGDGDSMCEFTDPLEINLLNFNDPQPTIDDYTWKAPIQEHPKRKGFYRVAQPYAPEYNAWFEMLGDDVVGYIGLPDNEVRYFYLHAEDPQHVYYESWWTGFDGYLPGGIGQLYWDNRVWFNLDAGVEMDVIIDQKPEWFGTMVKGYCKVPADAGRFVYESAYGQGWLSFDCPFELLLPGAERVVELPEIEKPKGNWVELGTASFDDGLLSPTFTFPDGSSLAGTAKYDVEVMVDADNDKHFLVINPYNNEFWQGYDLVKFSELETYLEFDCSNPACVLVPIAYTNITLSGNDFYVADAQALLYYAMESTFDEIIDEGYTSSFEDGVITIGAESAVVGIGDSYEDLDVYDEGYPTTLVLPNAVAKSHYVNKCAATGARKAASLNVVLRKTFQSPAISMKGSVVKESCLLK